MKLLQNKTSPAQDGFSEESGSLIQSLPYPVSLIDPEFNILTYNRAYAEVLTRACGNTRVKCFEVFHNNGKPPHDCPLLETLRSGKEAKSFIYEPTVQKHYLEITAPVGRGETGEVIIHTLIDITGFKESNSEIVELYANTINNMKEKEIRMQKGKDAFLNMLEDVNESFSELEDLFMKLIRVTVSALDAKSPWTRGHSERVSIFAENISREMALGEDDIKNLKLAGLLHDIGKLGTYDYLLEKPGALTKEEFEIVKRHPAEGVRILGDIKQLEDVIPFILFHHERLDGYGYPHGMKGHDIPLGARILHVADSYDSMTSDRPYRPAPGRGYALSELKKHKGTQFDPLVVEAFLKVLEREQGD